MVMAQRCPLGIQIADGNKKKIETLDEVFFTFFVVHNFITLYL